MNITKENGTVTVHGDLVKTEDIYYPNDDLIVYGRINASNIEARSIDAQSIDADRVTAESVSAGKIKVGDMYVSGKIKVYGDIEAGEVRCASIVAETITVTDLYINKVPSCTGSFSADSITFIDRNDRVIIEAQEAFG